MGWSRGERGAGRAGGDGAWFGGRREFFVCQVFARSLHLIAWFQRLYDRYLEDCLHGHLAPMPAPAREWHAVQIELLQQFTLMVGTEEENGPLWQLKDLCHRIWPQEDQEQQTHGVFLDWLVGSLFHECMKLKENLYLLSNYGARTAALDTLVERIGARQPQGNGACPLADVRILIGQIMEDVPRQMERVGSLFGQVTYILRLMLPVLAENRLVVRLLAEQEEIVAEIWGETLAELFAGIFAGGAAAGFCLAGASLYRGQWYEQALHMYERALACDRCCHEALVRVAHLRAILGRDEARRKEQDCNRSSETFF